MFLHLAIVSKMGIPLFSVIAHSLLLASFAKAECESGWTPYKDEFCIKAFTDVLTYDEANLFCASQSTELSSATLVLVKEEEMQELLARYTADKFENFWLGGKFDNVSAQFKWEDGDPLTYTNWAEGYPRNITNAEYCIQLRPINAKMKSDLDGKWEDAVCQRRNLALCQRALPWSLEDATREIRKLRKEMAAVRFELSQELQIATSQLTSEIETAKSQLTHQLEQLNSRVVPIGSIYIEYHSQPNPVSLWPTLTWEDVTALYSGLFFRALGGASDSWGTIQTGCAPRISQILLKYTENVSEITNPVAIPEDGVSDWGYSGRYFHSGPAGYEGKRYTVKGCEVRPRNQAVRIWKRLA